MENTASPMNKAAQPDSVKTRTPRPLKTPAQTTKNIMKKAVIPFIASPHTLLNGVYTDYPLWITLVL
jgi:hypothetical protein